MIIFLLRILLAPVFIAAATLAGRKWGHAFSGWLIGFPFISAPISMVMALQNGLGFAGDAANGTIAGQFSVCLFSLAYFLLAQKFAWWIVAPVSLIAYFSSAGFWNSVSLPITWTFLVLVVFILILIWLMPSKSAKEEKRTIPKWDLPLRMTAAAVFVFFLTGLSSLIGPKLSGLFSAFPVFGLILAIFTHAQQDGKQVSELLRGSVLGSFGIAFFYLTIGLFLNRMGSMWVYALAAIAALAANGLSLIIFKGRGVEEEA